MEAQLPYKAPLWRPTRIDYSSLLSTDTYYAVTVKLILKNRDPTEESYLVWIDHAKSKGLELLTRRYERDSKGKLHLHALGIGRSNIFKELMLLYGFHQRIDRLKCHADKVKWESYIDKDLPS